MLNLVHSAVAGTLLRELKPNEDTECPDKFPVAYPLKVNLPELASPSLLDRVQNIPDVEGPLRILKRQRTKESSNTVYVQTQAKSRFQDTDNTGTPLIDKVKKFLQSDQKVFLILGDSGAGKSKFCRKLELDLWQSYKSKDDRIPLHINLPAIDKPEIDMIAKQLRMDEFTETQIREMKHHRKFILICDGYDESQQTHNLYMSNRLNQPNEWDALMVISCSSEYLGSDYQFRFQPGDRDHHQQESLFQQAVITPFSTKQIHEYIKQHVSVKQPLWHEKDYNQALDFIPSLKDIVKNPFLMSLTLKVLPRMMDPGQHLSNAHITRITLYDHFIEHWLERGKIRLAEKDMSPSAREAFERLSAEGFTQNGIGYLKKFAVAIYKQQGGHPVVEYSHLVDEGSWKDEFFRRKEKQLLHEACPFTRTGNQHRFIHRSILEYGLARAVFDPQDRKNRKVHEPAGRRGSVSSTLSFEIHVDTDDQAIISEKDHPNPHSPLVWRSFVNDYSLMQFLVERVHQEPVFKNQLLAFIEHSKKDKKWRIAAANAITILVRAGVQFIGTDLRGIQIPGADLSYGVFDSVQLQEADMRKVNLQGAWLQKTDLSKTNMTGMQFGEQPYLTLESRVYSCAFSPDGRSLAIGIESGDIQEYSTTNWDITRTLKGHHGPVRGIAYSTDGTLMLSGCEDKTARIWVIGLGLCQHVLTGHTGQVHCVAYSPERDQVASASEDKTIRLWDPATGDHRQILFGHEGGVLCVVFSPSGRQISSGSDDCTVRLWNVASGECSHTFKGHGGSVWGIAFSPQRDQVASASHDETIRLWDVESGACRHILKGHTGEVNDVVYSMKGDQIFSGGSDRTIRVWDVQSGTCRHTMTSHESGVNRMAYSLKDDMVASINSDHAVRLWDVSVRGSRRVPSDRISNGHVLEVTDVKCSLKGNLIASCSKDRTIRLWDAETGTWLRTLSDHNDEIASVTFSPQGEQIGSGSTDNTVRLWDIETGTCQHTLTGHTMSVNSIAYSPQGDQVASASKDSTVRLWDTKTGTCQHILTGHTMSVKSIAYSPQGDQFASASEDDTVRLWNATTGEQCGSLDGVTDEVKGVIYSPDGNLIATRSDHAIRLWNVATMACTGTLEGHSDMIRDVVFSPQGDQLASASDDCTVRLWSVTTGDCQWILIGHNNTVLSVAYSHEGDLLASGSQDKTVRLWDVASGQCRAVIQNLPEKIPSVSWILSTDVNYLVTGCGRSVLKWQVTDEEGQCHVTLCWGATDGPLTATGALIQDVHGLTSLKKQLLKQRGAEGEPEHQRFWL